MCRIIIISSILFIATASANDCIMNIECGKCDRKSEFAWNPDTSFITDQLAYFFQLPEFIEAHYQQGNINAVDKYANDYLDLALEYRCNWNHGNAIHEANRYLGLISLKKMTSIKPQSTYFVPVKLLAQCKLEHLDQN